MESNMKKNLEKAIEVISGKIGGTTTADEALKYTQATLNAAHTLQVLSAKK